jgi:hypothetical protein
VEKLTAKASTLQAKKQKAMNRALSFQNKLGPLKMKLKVSLKAVRKKSRAKSTQM